MLTLTLIFQFQVVYPVFAANFSCQASFRLSSQCEDCALATLIGQFHNYHKLEIEERVIQNVGIIKFKLVESPASKAKKNKKSKKLLKY